MHLEFVNHASVLIQHGEISLLTDPWYKGVVVNNGWGLLAPSKFDVEDFERVTHIWFSHEHSDHFVPLILKEIPLETRKRITVLYQYTEDKKVINFCRDKLQFGEIIELHPGESFSLSQDFQFRCDPYTSGDSWFYASLPNCNILNINDCTVKTIDDARQIKSEIGTVDILLTQFGYAHKIGNEEDVEIRQEAASEKLQRIQNQIVVFKPKYLMPFASLSVFCHEENFYMNAEQVRINRVYDFISSHFPEVIPVILFPGDKYDFDGNFDSLFALQRYAELYENLKNYPKVKTRSVPLEQLLANGKKYGQRLVQKNPTAARLINKIGTKFYLTDYHFSLIFRGDKGFEKSSVPAESCDVKMSSDALNYTLLHEWGGMTCHGNARYLQTKNGDVYRFHLLMKMADMNNQGIAYKWRAPSLLMRCQAIVNKIKKYAQLRKVSLLDLMGLVL